MSVTRTIDDITDHRRDLRIALLDLGYTRVSTTMDNGDGRYSETFAGPLGEVVLNWDAKADALSKMTPATEYEDEIDGVAAEIYNLKAQSPRPMTPERWAGVKIKFPGSVRICRAEAIEQLGGDPDFTS